MFKRHLHEMMPTNTTTKPANWLVALAFLHLFGGLQAQTLQSDSTWIRNGQVLDQLAVGQSDNSTVMQKSGERFTIQVFSGRRTDASQVYQNLRDSVGTAMPLLLHFDEPNFKVYVGEFAFRLHAEHALIKWRLAYPQAFVLEAPAVRFTEPSAKPEPVDSPAPPQTDSTEPDQL